MMTKEVNNALVSGIQHMFAMRLPGHPPLDAADGTYQAWIAAFDSLPISWNDERDVPRIRQAFGAFMGNRRPLADPENADCLYPARAAPAAAGSPEKGVDGRGNS